MKIINVIYKILASTCMGLIVMWLLFNPSRIWMNGMSFGLRLGLFISMLLLFGFSIYLDYVKYNKKEKKIIEKEQVGTFTRRVKIPKYLKPEIKPIKQR